MSGKKIIHDLQIHVGKHKYIQRKKIHTFLKFGLDFTDSTCANMVVYIQNLSWVQNLKVLSGANHPNHGKLKVGVGFEPLTS